MSEDVPNLAHYFQMLLRLWADKIQLECVRYLFIKRSVFS